MSSRSETLRALFHEAIDIDAGERGAFFEERCGDDPDLRRELEQLLAHHDQRPPGYFASPFIDTGDDAGPAAGASVAGRYTLERVLGEGGMGIVWRARQENPRREVALKLIRPGFAGRELIRRFELEAAVLGRLNHPGIAQIHEAGMFDDGSGGRPFFAMELVDGVSLSAFVAARAPAARARLELFARICDAVHHAHQKGVIHRDLKPGNILVTNDGDPKVLDFGVARATDSDLQVTTLHTDAGRLVGTLAYMSPEQIEGNASGLDTRSDVYALGVVLYELLAGRLPHDVASMTIVQAARVISEQEPRSLDEIDRACRGDLTTIVARALEKDPARRYQSASDLAADVRRHLADEPIVARPATTMYQCRKFARRNRALVGGVAGVLIVLAAGASVSTVLAVRATRAGHRAVRSAAAARTQAYLANITSADSALRAHDVGAARRSLVAARGDSPDWEWQYLDSRLDGSVATWRGSMSAVYGVAFVPDGSHVVTGSFDRTVRLWRVPDGAVRILRGHRAPVNDVAVSPGGDVIVSAARDGEIRMWRTADGETIRVLTPHEGAVHTVAFSHDGTRIASGGADRVIRIADAATGAPVTELRGHERLVKDVAFSPDDTRLVSGSADGTVRQWDLATGAMVAATARGAAVNAVAFEPRGRRVAFGDADGLIRQWDPAAPERHLVLRGHEDAVTGLAFSPDGHRLVSSSTDETARIWNAATGAVEAVLRGHAKPLYAATWSPDGAWIATTAYAPQGEVRLWDAALDDGIDTLRGHRWAVSGVAFSPDGSRLLSGSLDGTVRAWDVATGVEIATLLEHDGRVTSVAMAPDGRCLAVTTDATEVLLLDPATGGRAGVLAGHEAFVACAAFSRDGRRLASGSGDTTIRVWDLATRACVATLAGHTMRVNAVAFSPDGARLASQSMDGSVRVWDVAGSRELLVIPSGGQPSRKEVAFSLDGARLAVADESAAVRFWDVATGAPVPGAAGEGVGGRVVAFAPDGRRLVCGTSAGEVQIWDPATGTRLLQLRGHRGDVRDGAFSGDGRVLATASTDTTIRIWCTAPVSERLRARRARPGLEAEAQPVVTRLFADLADAAAVVARLERDPDLSEPARRVALQLALREAVGRKGSHLR